MQGYSLCDGGHYVTINQNKELIEKIRNSEIKDLLDSYYLEHTLIPSLGFNDENLNEQPSIVKENLGGLKIWQYPNQFSKYLVFLSKQNVQSYLEIGCRWGGTCILTTEYLKKVNVDNNLYSVGVDIINSPLQNYEHCTFLQCSTRSKKFENFIRGNFFDVCFIDGDHTYDGIKNDYELCKNHARIFVFHDIINDACPGVVKFWNEVKINRENYEFIEQYSDVNGSYLGIGVLI